MKNRWLAVLTFGLAVLAMACSGSEGGTSAATTTTDAGAAPSAAPTTTDAGPPDTAGGPTSIDRPPPTTVAGQVFAPEVCSSLLGALRAVTLPVEGTTDFGAQLDVALAAIDEAAAAAPGYPADQLAVLKEQLEDARPGIEDQGFYGWQLAIAAHRDGPDEQDIEVQLENYRQYVVPRC